MHAQLNDTAGRRKPVVAILLLAVAIAAAIMIAKNSRAHQAEAPVAGRPALTVTTTKLRDDKWARTLLATGSIMQIGRASCRERV